MFSQASVILSTGGGQTHPLWVDTPPSAYWDTTPAQCMLGYMPPPPPPGTTADGTHPTGMHSLSLSKLTSKDECNEGDVVIDGFT